MKIKMIRNFFPKKIYQLYGWKFYRNKQKSCYIEALKKMLNRKNKFEDPESKLKLCFSLGRIWELEDNLYTMEDFKRL